MSNIFNILDFGAIGDGVTMNTQAIQNALDTASKVGGTVLIPAGGSFVIGTIYLRSHVTIHVEENARLCGSPRLVDYAKDTGLNPYYPEMIDRCLIYGHNVTDIGFTGRGTIDGCYDPDTFVRPADADERESKQRPMLVRIEECTNIHIQNVRFTGSCSWCVHLKYNDNIRISDVTIDNRRQDGFNIESCTNTTIVNCNLMCGDDAIALTTSHKDRPIHNLTISNCLMTTRWSAIRMGPLSKGNFENVTVSNCVFHECNGGGLKLGMYEGAEIRNCTFSNIVMDRCVAPINLLVDRFYDIGNPNRTDELMPLGSVHDLMFSNIRAIACNYPVLEDWQEKWKMDQFRSHTDLNYTIFIHGYPGSEIYNLHFDNISIDFEGGGTAEMGKRRDVIDMDEFGPEEYGYWTDGKSCWGHLPAYGIYARHAKKIRGSQIRFGLVHEDGRPPMHFKECSDIQFDRIETERAADQPVAVCVDSNRISLSRYLGSEEGELIATEGNCSDIHAEKLF